MPSHRVVVFKRKQTDHPSLPPEVLTESKHYIGSVFVGGAPLRGLTTEDEKKYLAEYLSLDPEEKDFREKTTKFWVDMRVKVTSTGHPLEIGEVGGEPINLRDWITYKWLEKHPLVVAKEDELYQSPLARFYIFDPEVKKVDDAAAALVEREAMKKLIAVLDDEERTSQLLRVLGGGNPDLMTASEREVGLQTIVKAAPQRFLDVEADKALEQRALINDLVTSGVVQQVLTTYSYEDVPFAHDEAEAVTWLGNTKNSKTITAMKAKLRAAKKATAKG